MCSGCGSVGRAVASDTREPQFESIHQLILFSINCIKNFVVKNGPIFKTKRYILPSGSVGAFLPAVQGSNPMDTIYNCGYYFLFLMKLLKKNENKSKRPGMVHF